MTGSNQKIIILAGGTGGHIFPGLAVAEDLRKRGAVVYWLGAEGGMECQRVPAAGIPIGTVNIGGLRGKGIARWLLLPWKLGRAVGQALSIMRRENPGCAVSFGGYAAGPGGLAARLRGIPVVIHEQNRIPGLTNKVLARFAYRILEAFPGSWPPKYHAETVGNPVRSDLAGLPAPQLRLAGRQGPMRLLITGGSQGARSLNQVLPEAIARLPGNLAIEIRHQAGKGRAIETAEAYSKSGLQADVQEFIEDMAEAYAWADLVVCRSGALTVSELASVGLPAILVPFPFAVDDHQTRNAEFLVDAGAARLQPEATCNADSLAGLLAELLGNRETLLKMAQSAHALSIPHAAEHVADICLQAAAA